MRSLVALAALALTACHQQSMPAIGVQRPLSIEEKIVRESGPRLAPLALAIAWKESRFHPKAISRTKDFGVFQIHASTAVKLHLWNPLDEDLNIVAGVGLLRVGLELYGSDAGAACYFRHPAKCAEFAGIKAAE